MDALNTILNSSVLGNFLWVALIIVVLLVFRKELIGLLTRVKEAEWGPRKLKFAEVTIEPPPQRSKASRDGALFQLGLTLMWAVVRVSVGSRNEDILKALRTSASDARACGLQAQAEALEDLRRKVQTHPTALSLKDKEALGDNLVSLRKEIAEQLEKE